MSNEVQFDFEDEKRPEYSHSGSKLVKVVIKLSGGRVDETQANYILLGIALVAFVLSFFLFPDRIEISPPQIPPTLSVL